MRIRPLISSDRERLQAIQAEVLVFTEEEIKVAMELIDITLRDEKQEDYRVACAVGDDNHPIGYICFGPIPMTEGTFDLYWIVVDPHCHGQRIGSELFDYLLKEVRRLNGRMILADTSSLSSYEKAQKFYVKKGFQEVARIADYYWKGNDRITYCKKLKV